MNTFSGNSEELSPVKRALLALEVMQARLTALENEKNEPVAVIGMSCRFPGGADTPESFWQVLLQGRDTICQVPTNRWESEEYYDPNPEAPGKMSTRWGGFLEQVDNFDAAFFGITPREAAGMDPQQRLLLEVAFEALEDAGQVVSRLAGSKTGVFVGIASNDYAWQLLDYPASLDGYSATGNAHSIAANRLSYLWDLRGPSLAIDTACSSSLVAINLACQSLRSGETQMALVGGVNLMLSPLSSIAFSRSYMLAPDGRCKTFDALADGFVRGEGCGVVVLKRLSEAQAAGDRILAVIRGSAVNQDGHTNGLMAPNGLSQQKVIRQALQHAGVTASQVSYIEAHGTGTALGDPIEVEALAQVYGAANTQNRACLLGSVKTNIGHLEAAAGIAGFIKVVLSLQHETIPPHLHFHQLNPHIPVEQMTFTIPRAPYPWPHGEEPRHACLSSFGFGGTNAHMIVGEYHQLPSESAEDTSSSRPCYLLPLSARGPQALRALAEAYLPWLEKAEATATPTLRDTCYTASIRRSHYPQRLTVVGHTLAELRSELQALVQEEIPGQSQQDGQPSKLAFVFSGQGSQWWGMGRQLLEQEPVFRTTLEQCDAWHQHYAGWSLLQALQTDQANYLLDDTEFAQPVLFALQVALTALWRSWGIVPAAVVGHSVGEVAAAYTAGVLTLREAVYLVFKRGILMQRMTGQGKMASIRLAPAKAAQALNGYQGRVAIAASNSPVSTVISGEPEAIEELLVLFREREISARRLSVNYAFHSPQMASLQEDLIQSLQELDPQPASLALYSTVSGKAATTPIGDAAYWAKNSKDPVRFAEAIGAMVQDGYTTFIEIGPHPVLVSAISQCLQAHHREGIVLSSLRRDIEERSALLRTLGTLYSSGYSVTWETLYPEGARSAALPLYPWQRTKHWLEIPPQAPMLSRKLPLSAPKAEHPLLGSRQKSVHATGTPFWEMELTRESAAFLKDHQIQDTILFPGAAYIEMALSGALALLGDRACKLTTIILEHALVLPEQSSCELQTSFTPVATGECHFAVYSRQAIEPRDAEWTRHAHGTILYGAAERVERLVQTPHFVLEEIRGRCWEEIPSQAYYLMLHKAGLAYGPAFQGIQRLWRGENEALGEIGVPACLEEELDQYQLHPAILDACFQVLGASLFGTANHPERSIYLPVGVDQITLYRQPGRTLWSYARWQNPELQDPHTFTGDIILLTEEGLVAGEVQGLHLRALEQASQYSRPTGNTGDLFYELQWQIKPRQQSSQTEESSQPAQGRWLLFLDTHQIGQELQALLGAKGAGSVLVTPGQNYDQSEPGHYQIDPTNPDDFRTLLREAFPQTEAPCCGIVHLWSLNRDMTEASSSPELVAGHILTCGSVLHLVQALNATGWQTLPRLWLVTRGGQPIGEATLQAVTQAPVWGFGRTLAHEYPALWGGLIDLDTATSTQQAAHCLAVEIHDAQGEDQLAYREQQRFVARLVPGSLSHQPPVFPLRFHTDATYLISGGLGELGLLIARWATERGARHLLLLSRTDLPARSSWQQVEKSSRLTRQIEGIRAIERLGGHVHLAHIDIADEERLRNYLETYCQEQWPPVRGVIHTAGVLRDKTMQWLNLSDIADVFHPKVEGAWTLHRLFKNEPLDFFVHFSSATSLLGSPGQANYTAANAFLDALAHYQRTQGLPALSINWGAWSEAGMAARLNSEARLLSNGIQSIMPAQGLEVLACVLEQEEKRSQIGVFRVDWQVLRGLASQGNRFPLLTTLLQETSEEHLRRVNSADTVESIRAALLAEQEETARQLLVGYLRQHIARGLGLAESRIDPARSLTELGFDSLVSLELRNRLEAELGVKLSVVSFLQGVSVTLLAGQILDQLHTILVTRSVEVKQQPEQASEFALSYGQRALWFLHYLAPTSAAYNLSFASLILSEIDISRLQRALETLVKRHPSLRTTFHAHNGEPAQYIHDNLCIDFCQENVSDWDEDQIQNRLVVDAQRPFDLEQGPLLRISLYQRSDQPAILLLSTHHIICDFWSLVQIVNELRTLYSTEAHVQGTLLEPLEREYQDYVSWQERMLAGPEGERHWAYWREELAGELPVLSLPTDHAYPPVQTFQGASQAFQIDENTASGLRELARMEGATLYMTLLAAFQTLLSLYTNQTDILVGSPAADRKRQEFEGMVGYFINPIVLRANFASQPSFRQFLSQVRQKVLAALEHQDYPFALLVERLQPIRDPSRAPIVQALFILQKAHLLAEQGMAALALAESGVQMNIADLSLESLALPQRVAQFELTLMIADVEGALPASLQYNTDLFEASTIERMSQHFLNLLQGIVADPDQSIADLPLLTPFEQQQILIDWNKTTVPYPREACLHQLFEVQVQQRPEALAAIFQDQQITYRDLDMRASLVAHHLQKRGASPGRLIGLCVERSIELLIGLLGILKTGAAYVPLDATYPKDRLTFICADTQMSILLTQEQLLTDLPHTEAQILLLDQLAQNEDEEGFPPANASLPVLSENLAYVIYTSGSTGKPKGVQIPHRAVVNLLSAMRQQLGLTEQDVLLSITTPSFDISALEFFLPLTTGACVALANQEDVLNGSSLKETLSRVGATLMQGTPTSWSLLLDTNWQGSIDLKALCGGETLTRELATRLLLKSSSLWNMYGPTETTIWSATARISAVTDRITLGTPIANTRMYILDRFLHPVPVGVQGELYIGGDGLAWGYLNRPELTAEKFLPDPFASQPGQRLYKTGDLACYRPDGTIEFQGRVDQQIKLHGFRIELGEIEELLRQHRAVESAVVLISESQDTNTFLAAYIVLVPNIQITSSELRAFLQEQLPPYMLPSTFTFLSALPLLPNGKVNRRALPDPQGPLADGAPKATALVPRTEAEQIITIIWQEVLQREDIDMQRNFFEVGGHSLRLVQVHSRLQQAFHIQISVVDLFQYPTIATQARYVSEVREKQNSLEQSDVIAEKHHQGRVRLKRRFEQARQVARELRNGGSEQ